MEGRSRPPACVGHTSRPLRLVLYQRQKGEAHFRSWALLFAPDPTPYSRPVAAFTISDRQELPRLAPGALVEVEGDLTPGSTDLVVRAGDVTFRTTRLGSMAVGYAEARGSTVLVHPDLASHISPYAKAVLGPHGVTKAGWHPERWASEYRAAALLSGVWLAGLVVLVVLSLARGRPVFDGSTWFYLAGEGCVLCIWWRRRRLAKAGRAARVSGQHQTMRARLWWSPNPEGGASAWVSLYDDGGGEVVSQKVVGLPPDLELPGDGTVEVIGAPVEGHVVVVRAGGTDLLPASECVSIGGG